MCFSSLSKLAPFKVTPHHFARIHQPMLSATGLKMYERVSGRTHGLNVLLFVCEQHFSKFTKLLCFPLVSSSNYLPLSGMCPKNVDEWL